MWLPPHCFKFIYISGSYGLRICLFFYVFILCDSYSASIANLLGQVFYRLQLVGYLGRPSPMPGAIAHFDCDLDHDSFFFEVNDRRG